MQETEMDFESRIVTSDFTPEDNDIENSLRPKVLDDYIGQDKVKENLAVYIQAARGSTRPCSFVWSSRSRKNYSCRCYCK